MGDMSTATKISKKLTSLEPIYKLVITVFFIGAAWARLEYKSDSDKKEVITVLEKYIIQNEADKKMFEFKQADMSGKITDNIAQLKMINEFLRPEEIGLSASKTYRRTR